MKPLGSEVRLTALSPVQIKSTLLDTTEKQIVNALVIRQLSIYYCFHCNSFVVPGRWVKIMTWIFVTSSALSLLGIETNGRRTTTIQINPERINHKKMYRQTHTYIHTCKHRYTVHAVFAKMCLICICATDSVGLSSTGLIHIQKCTTLFSLYFGDFFFLRHHVTPFYKTPS